MVITATTDCSLKMKNLLVLCYYYHYRLLLLPQVITTTTDCKKLVLVHAFYKNLQLLMLLALKALRFFLYVFLYRLHLFEEGAQVADPTSF